MMRSTCAFDSAPPMRRISSSVRRFFGATTFSPGLSPGFCWRREAGIYGRAAAPSVDGRIDRLDRRWIGGAPGAPGAGGALGAAGRPVAAPGGGPACGGRAGGEGGAGERVGG